MQQVRIRDGLRLKAALSFRSRGSSIPTRPIDGDAPAEEGICAAHIQVMDAFDMAQLGELLSALAGMLDDEIPEARHEPDENVRFRGGPYLLGGIHRRAWRIRWERVGASTLRSLDVNELERMGRRDATLIVQWADFLPFVVVVIREEPQPETHLFTSASESLLDSLPGRLGPTNRTPRHEAEVLICAKISEERMDRILDCMTNGEGDATLRTDLAQALKFIGPASGAVHLESTASNLLLAEGSGGSDDMGWYGPFRAFLFSKGNLGPHRAWEWDIPMWIPSAMGTSSWSDFNFRPFLYASIRSAQDVSVRAGELDETLTKVTRSRSDNHATGGEVPAEVHERLVRLHSRLQMLQTALHLSSTRSPIGPERSDEWGRKLHYRLEDSRGWPMRSSSWTSEVLKDSKLQSEADARQVLEGLERRLDRALDLVTVVENRRLNRSMRRWTIGSAALAGLAIVIAVALEVLPP